jgi:hypothetical protein
MCLLNAMSSAGMRSDGAVLKNRIVPPSGVGALAPTFCQGQKATAVSVSLGQQVEERAELPEVAFGSDSLPARKRCVYDSSAMDSLRANTSLIRMKGRVV